MDKACVMFDGYIVYRVSTTRGVRFIIDQGDEENNRVIIPMFRISNGYVRGYHWDGDTSKDIGNMSDYECLQANVDAAKKHFELESQVPIKTTIVIIGDDGYYGIAVVPGFVAARIKEEEVFLTETATGVREPILVGRK